jgi:hypothetical protein
MQDDLPSKMKHYAEFSEDPTHTSDSEVILSGVSIGAIPNVPSSTLEEDLIITNRRLILLHHIVIKPTNLQISGDIPALFNAIRELSKNSQIGHILDEIIESDLLNRSYYYENITEAEIQSSKHWWQSNHIKVKGIAIMGNKKQLKLPVIKAITKEHRERLSEELIKVDGLKGKLTFK